MTSRRSGRTSPGPGSVRRPWGTYTVVGQWSGKITVKILRVDPRSRLSLQRHRHRDEEWLCLRGSAEVRVGDRTTKVNVGDRTVVPRNRLHRIYSERGAEFLEVSTGKFSEDDIVRVEDDYGRAGGPARPSSQRRPSAARRSSEAAGPQEPGS